MSQPQPAAGAPIERRPAKALLASAPGILRRHWLATVLVIAGVVLRAVTWMAYHPAIIYIDTLKYLYGAWPGSDPIAYKIPLRLILAFGDLGTVGIIQHLLGVAMGVTIYVLLIRRGAPRWLGALAMAPVLLDAYQLQTEAMIMPDVWFEALIVAGVALLLWQPRPRLAALVLGAAMLGASTGLRQVGEVLIVPLLVYVVALGGRWRAVLKNAVAVTAAFSLAVLAYMAASYARSGHFWISRSSTSLTYGRMAEVADCATLKIPAVERPLCPTKAEQAKGPDWLEHDAAGPYRSLAATLPPSLQGHTDEVTARFNRAVELQQPLRVLAGIARDAVKLFALTRRTSPGDTPIWRWQFQGNFPSYHPYIFVRPDGIWLNFPPSGPLHAQSIRKLSPAYGGPPQVDADLASFLRRYQLGGGYTPGPLLALFVITGLAGSVLLLARKRLPRKAIDLAAACSLFFVAGVAILGASDFFEFSWRYQMPAVVTLPPAGALGIAVLIAVARKSRTPAAGDAVPGRAPELAAPAS